MSAAAARQQKIFLQACLAASTTLVGGFGVLGLWSAVGPTPLGLPSFGDYVGDTIGDGVFLPITVFGVVFALGVTRTVHTPFQRNLVVVGAFASALSGVLAQLSWYVDPNPKLNWLIPRAHTFSVVGWYHLGFVVLTSAAVGAWMTGILINLWIMKRSRTNDQRLHRLLRSNGASTVISAAALFLTTVVIDSTRSFYSLATFGVLSFAGVSTIVVVLLLLLTVGKASLSIIPPILVSLVASATLLEYLGGPARSNPMCIIWFLAALLAGIGAGFRKYSGENVIKSTNVGYIMYPALTILAVLLTARLPPSTSLIAVLGSGFIVVPFLSVVTSAVRTQARQSIFAHSVQLLMVMTVALSAILERYRPAEPVIVKLINAGLGFLVPLVIGVFCNYAIRVFWAPLITAEQTHRDDSNRDEVLHAIGILSARTFIMGYGLSIGIFLAAVSLIFLIVDNTVSLEGSARVWLPLPIITSVILITSLIATIPTINQFFRFHPLVDDTPSTKNPQSARSQTLSIVMLGIITAATLGLALQAGWNGTISAVAFGITAGVSLDTVEGCLVNSTFLCFDHPRRRSAIVAIMIGVATGAATYWAILIGAGSGGLTIGVAVAVLFGVLIARFGIVVYGASLVYAAGNSWYATDRAPGWNIIKDECERAALIVIVIWLPMFVYTHSSVDYALVNVLVVGGGSIAITTPAGAFAGEQLMRHFDDQCLVRFGGRFADRRRTEKERRDDSWLEPCLKRITDYRSPELRVPLEDKPAAYIRALGAHLSFQILVRLFLVVLTIIGFVVVIVSGLTLGMLPNPQDRTIR